MADMGGHDSCVSGNKKTQCVQTTPTARPDPSWAAFGPSITWCGWQFCFRTETACLAQPKLDKLCAQLLQLLQHKRVPRKELEACLGLLMWATSISSLRCFTAPRYSDLRSPSGTCYPVLPRSWSQFL